MCHRIKIFCSAIQRSTQLICDHIYVCNTVMPQRTKHKVYINLYFLTQM